MTTDTTVEERVTLLEASAYRHEQRLKRTDAAIEQINGKLDDLSGQVHEVRLSVRELSDRVANVEARLDEHGALLQRIVAKLDA